MCGIMGYYGLGEGPGREALGRMTEVLAPRGPDDRGAFHDGPFGVGHTRLSIIDVAGGHQPIFNESADICVVCNGEIYDFEKLRDSLRARGHRFATGSDTEVLVHLYEDERERMLDKIDGMFAFAVYDRTRGVLFLARDRMGMKPLYYTQRNGAFVFASEAKALLAVPELSFTLNVNALNHYLSLQYVPDTMSMFAEVAKLGPAEYLVFSGGKVCKQETYWSLQVDEQRPPGHDVDEEVRRLVRRAVRRRMVAEVPLGSFLSGGIDSSIVTASMARQSSMPVKTFSIGFRESNFSELHTAKTIARRYGTDHHEYELSLDTLRTELVPILSYFDEPLADSSALPAHYLCAQTRRDVHVALSGDGGDELFAGYQRYGLDRFVNRHPLLTRVMAGLTGILGSQFRVRLDRPIGRDMVTGLKRLSQVLSIPRSAGILRWGSYFSPADKQKLFRPDVLAAVDPWESVTWLTRFFDMPGSGAGDLNRTLFADLRTYAPGDYLVKMDRMSMRHGLEVRCPMLDTRLVEYAFSLGPSVKMTRRPKELLRRAFADDLTPEVLGAPKRGFSVPVGLWMQQGWMELYRDFAARSDSISRKYFNRGAIEELMAEHRRGINNHGRKLYALLALEIWAERYL